MLLLKIMAVKKISKPVKAAAKNKATAKTKDTTVTLTAKHFIEKLQALQSDEELKKDTTLF